MMIEIIYAKNTIKIIQNIVIHVKQIFVFIVKKNIRIIL